MSTEEGRREEKGGGWRRERRGEERGGEERRGRDYGYPSLSKIHVIPPGDHRSWCCGEKASVTLDSITIKA